MLEQAMLTLCVQVFRRKRKLYLVFEYVDHTILGMTQKTATAIVKSSQTFAKLSFQALILLFAEELEEHPSGLDEETARKHVFQVIRAINFCHQNQVSYRQHCTKHLHSKLRSK